MSGDATLSVVRAFTCFSQLSNLAEGLHHNRRRRAYQLAGSPPQEGSLARALQRLAGVAPQEPQSFFVDALISPVLTAHPTEVQCKSILDCLREIAMLLAVDVFLCRRGTVGMEILREMYRRWPFFRALLSNMDMVLAKSDIHIASLYAELVPDEKLRRLIFGRIRREIQSSIGHLLTITEQAELLDSNPWLARGFRNRAPYVDPLNHLQVEALKRYRAGDTDEKVRRAVLLTINGLAAGLRNSG